MVVSTSGTRLLQHCSTTRQVCTLCTNISKLSELCSVQWMLHARILSHSARSWNFCKICTRRNVRTKNRNAELCLTRIFMIMKICILITKNDPCLSIENRVFLLLSQKEKCDANHLRDEIQATLMRLQIRQEILHSTFVHEGDANNVFCTLEYQNAIVPSLPIAKRGRVLHRI